MRPVLACVVLLACSVPGLATGAAQAGGSVLELSSLGISEPVVLSGPSAEQVVSVPIPRGLRPVELVARVRSSPGAVGASLQVSHEGRTLEWVRLTEWDTHLLVPLRGARVASERWMLLFRLEAPEGASDCAGPQRIRVEIDQLRVRAEGVPQPPGRIAEFWPPVLRALHVQLPDSPSVEEATAALRLAGLAARLAAGRQLTITVSSESEPPVPADALWSRRVRISRGGSSRLALLSSGGDGMPILEIAGPPDSLEASLEALDSYRETLQAPAVSGLRAVAGTPAPDRATLASLGYPQVQMVGSGTLEATIFFAQADLGGPVRGVALRLAGRTTPVPPGGHAQLWVLLNGGLVHAEPVLGGSFDKWISLPDGLLRRDNNLVIRLVYTPPGGECAPGAHPIGIIVDGASYLEFQRGTRLPAGFERLPQGLLPVFTVGLDPVSHETIGGAAQVVAAAQQVSRVRLVPKVRSWEDALAAPGPLLLVTLDPGKVGALRPPLEPRPFRVVDVEGREVLRMEMGQPFVVMEAFSSGGREVLMVTRHGDRPDLRELKRALDPRLGWYALSGDVWIWPHGGTPVAMRLRESGLRVVPLGPPPLLRWEKIRFGVMGVAVAAVVIFLVWVYPRLVRSGPPPAQPR